MCTEGPTGDGTVDQSGIDLLHLIVPQTEQIKLSGHTGPRQGQDPCEALGQGPTNSRQAHLPVPPVFSQPLAPFCSSDLILVCPSVSYKAHCRSSSRTIAYFDWPARNTPILVGGRDGDMKLILLAKRKRAVERTVEARIGCHLRALAFLSIQVPLGKHSLTKLRSTYLDHIG